MVTAFMRVGLAAALVGLWGHPEARAGETGDIVRVMTYNIRYGTADDGENQWDLRKAFLVDAIRAADPDLLGTQETLAFQRDYLSAHLPGYACCGVGREDGKEKGEMAALFYRKERWELLDSGHFWLSTTPEKPGSRSWDSALPRMVSWVKLRDRHRPAAAPVDFFNTHFDHRGEQARLESARLLRRKVEAAGGCSVIVTGDFNSGEEDEPYRALFGSFAAKPASLVDAYRVAHPEREAAEGTFTGFDAGAATGTRIDWIGASRDWQIHAVRIDRTAHGGRTPSDHFPVVAELGR